MTDVDLSSAIAKQNSDTPVSSPSLVSRIPFLAGYPIEKNRFASANGRAESEVWQPFCLNEIIDLPAVSDIAIEKRDAVRAMENVAANRKR
jgi:hypothetical protein